MVTIQILLGLAKWYRYALLPELTICSSYAEERSGADNCLGEDER